MSTESVRKRLEAATPGPWSQGMIADELIPEVDYSAAFGFIVVKGEQSDDGAGGLNDADLIAHAPTDLRLALDVIEAAKAVRGAASGSDDLSTYRRLLDALDAFEAAE